MAATNFSTPATLDTAALLGPLERRLQQLEKEVFSENIPLEVTDNGSLYVNVLIGGKNLRMVLDSGASVLSLSKAVADELGITIPADAPRLQLVMAMVAAFPDERLIWHQFASAPSKPQTSAPRSSTSPESTPNLS